MGGGVADQERGAGEGHGAPFVEVEGERIGFLDAVEQRGEIGVKAGKRAEGAVDVKPDPLLGGNGGEFVERVDCASVHRASGSDDAEGRVALLPPGGDFGAQGAGVNREFRRDRDEAKRVRRQAKNCQGFASPTVNLGGGIENGAGGFELIPGDNQSEQVGHGPRGAEDTAGVPGEAHELSEPTQRCLFGYGRGVIESGEMRVQAGGDEIAQSGKGKAAPLDPSPEAWVTAVHGIGGDTREDVGEGSLGANAGLGKALVREKGSLFGRHGTPDRLRGKLLDAVEGAVKDGVRGLAEGGPIVRVERGSIGVHPASLQAQARLEIRR